MDFFLHSDIPNSEEEIVRRIQKLWSVAKLISLMPCKHLTIFYILVCMVHLMIENYFFVIWTTVDKLGLSCYYSLDNKLFKMSAFNMALLFAGCIFSFTHLGIPHWHYYLVSLFECSSKFCTTWAVINIVEWCNLLSRYCYMKLEVVKSSFFSWMNI